MLCPGRRRRRVRLRAGGSGCRGLSRRTSSGRRRWRGCECLAVSLRQTFDEPRQTAAATLTSRHVTGLPAAVHACSPVHNVDLVADTRSTSPVGQPVRQQRPPTSLLVVAVVRVTAELFERRRHQTHHVVVSGGASLSLHVARVRIVLHQQIDLALCVVQQVDWRRRQTTLDRQSDVGVDVHLISARLGHVIDVDQSRQLLPVRGVGRLPVLLALLPEYRILFAELITQKRLRRNTQRSKY